jgi:hypothetical protein
MRPPDHINSDRSDRTDFRRADTAVIDAAGRPVPISSGEPVDDDF